MCWCFCWCCLAGSERAAMKTQQQILEAATCGNRLARQEAAGAAARSWNLAPIPCKRMAQLTDGAWSVTATCCGQGTFLVRRRKERRAGCCELLDFEIRRIDLVRAECSGTNLETATIKQTEEKE